MKKATLAFFCLLFGLSTLLFAGKLLCNGFGYTFKLVNASIYAIIISVLAMCTSVLSIISKKSEGNVIRILSIVNVPLSLFNILLYIFECPSTLVYVCMIITAGLALFLAVWHGKHFALRIAGAVLATLTLLLICYFVFFFLLFGNIGYTNIVKSVESPNGEYRAEVLDVNQGALGGDTVVDVYKNDKYFNFYILSISKKPQRVYYGDWGEFDKMNIYWKDNHCLMINSVEYEIE